MRNPGGAFPPRSRSGCTRGQNEGGEEGCGSGDDDLSRGYVNHGGGELDGWGVVRERSFVRRRHQSRVRCGVKPDPNDDLDINDDVIPVVGIATGIIIRIRSVVVGGLHPVLLSGVRIRNNDGVRLEVVQLHSLPDPDYSQP